MNLTITLLVLVLSLSAFADDQSTFTIPSNPPPPWHLVFEMPASETRDVKLTWRPSPGVTAYRVAWLERSFERDNRHDIYTNSLVVVTNEVTLALPRRAFWVTVAPYDPGRERESSPPSEPLEIGATPPWLSVFELPKLDTRDVRITWAPVWDTAPETFYHVSWLEASSVRDNRFDRYTEGMVTTNTDAVLTLLKGRTYWAIVAVCDPVTGHDRSAPSAPLEVFVPRWDRWEIITTTKRSSIVTPMLTDSPVVPVNITTQYLFSTGLETNVFFWLSVDARRVK